MVAWILVVTLLALSASIFLINVAVWRLNRRLTRLEDNFFGRNGR